MNNIKQDDWISAYREEIRDEIRNLTEKSLYIIKLREQQRRMQIIILVLDVVAIMTAVGAFLTRFLF